MQNVSKRVLLVGATGYAGRQLANYLLKETDATVILAGRSRAKLDDLRSGLRQQDLAHRLEVLELDASFRDYKSEMYQDGQWQKLRYASYPRLEFEYGFGELLTYPVAMIKQLLNGKVQPGIHLMGVCCDPVQLLEDIGRTDVSITQQLFS
jgi:hypothetical protein